MSRPYASPLLFDTGVSIVYRRLILFVALFCFLAILSLDSSYFNVQIILLLLLGYIILSAWRQNIAWQCHAKMNGEWTLTHKSRRYEVMLHESSFVTPLFAILCFVTKQHKRHYVYVFQDNIKSDDFRKLRVKLKVEAMIKLKHDKLSL